MNLFIRPLVFLLLITSVTYGQDKPKRIPKHKTVLSLGLTASPDIYIYDFKAYPNFSFSYDSKVNYSAGITAVYYPVKFISIRAALLYSTKGFSLDYNYKTPDPNVASTYVNPDSVAVNTELKADYLDIPIILHFNLIHRDRIQLFVAAGIVPGVLVSKAQETLYKSAKTRATDDLSRNFNEFVAGTIYSIGFKYNLSPKFGIGFDPYFRYYLNKIDKQAMSSNPISFGGKIAVYINFIHKHHRNNNK